MKVATDTHTAMPPADILAASSLQHRPPGARSLHAEVAAFCELSEILSDDPGKALSRYIETARRFCIAGSAGLSLLRLDSAGRSILRWEAIRGLLSGHEGAESLPERSPCGQCLDAGATIFVSREGAFPGLRTHQPAITAALITPLYGGSGQPLGTLWAAHHDFRASFCSIDARILEQVAIQLSLSPRLLASQEAIRSGKSRSDSALTTA